MIQENIPLAGKTTMRIGGTARYYAEPKTKDDVEAAWSFAMEHDVPLIVLGSGSNTIFAEGLIEALVIRLKAERVERTGNRVRVEAGKNLAMLVNECAKEGFDLSPLTGIPGTIGGAIFGNAGQGPTGVWIDHFIESVTVFEDEQWRTLSKKECDFLYRESVFKHGPEHAPVIFEATLVLPAGDPLAIQEEVERLLQKRIETQPHVKTAGSCFKAVGETPAWKLIDAAGLRGLKIGDVEIATKHANFLLNTGQARYEDAKMIVERVKTAVQEPLDVEMRFIETDGSLAF